MGLRPAKCYRSLKDRAYTRIAVTVHKKNYVGTAPALKIRQFNMGSGAKDFSHIVDLIVKSSLQIRDNALEAARIAINKLLTKELGKDGYFMKIRIYPHHILRENKQAQGAGADRVSEGMSHSFGKVIGRSARVRKGQIVVSVLVNEKDVDVAKEALQRANAKFPCKIETKIHTDVESIGTRPIKVIEDVKTEEEEKIEEKEGEEKKEGEEAGETKEGDKAQEGAEDKGTDEAKEKKDDAKAEDKKEGKK